MRRRLPTVVIAGLAAAAGCADGGLGGLDQGIIGGTPSAVGAFPAVGALYEGGPTCTATLIAPDAVLTAAHCLHPGAGLPAFTLDADARGAVDLVTVVDVVIHPDWDVDRAISDGPTQYFDLAVLRLGEPVEVAPAIVAGPADGRRLTAGTPVTMVGYGQTVDGDPTSAGLKVDAIAPVVATSPSELQVSNPGDPQNCYGDSGGPALADLGAGQRVVGVVSRGATTATTCDQGSVDTRVDYYLPWLRAQVPELCAGGDVCAGGTGEPDPSAGFGAEITGGCAAGGGGRGGALAGLAGLAVIVCRARRRVRRA